MNPVEAKAIAATISPNEIRDVLDRLLAYASISAKFTPHDLDTKCLAFVQTLVNTPGMMQEIFHQLNEGLSTELIIARLRTPT